MFLPGSLVWIYWYDEVWWAGKVVDPVQWATDNGSDPLDEEYCASTAIVEFLEDGSVEFVAWTSVMELDLATAVADADPSHVGTKAKLEAMLSAPREVTEEEVRASEVFKQVSNERDVLQKKVTAQTAEIENLKKQVVLLKQQAAKAAAAPSASAAATAKAPVAAADKLSFTAVAKKSEIEALQKLPGVTLFRFLGEGPIVEERENPVVITTGSANLLPVVQALKCPTEIIRDKKPVPDTAPPPVDKQATAGAEDEDDDSKKKDEPKISVPDQEVKASTDIEMGEWDGEVALSFQWVDEASPYSEFNDPAGTNWWCEQNVRKAPGKPRKVALEWRQGVGGKWTELATDKGFGASITVKPEKVEGSAYRGFQSRWIVDGDRYLSPLQLAPTLQSKLMTYPSVRSAIKQLPPDKQSIENIPNKPMRDALMAVENIIPMNTWDVDYGVTRIPGAYLDEKQVLTATEKVEMLARAKTNDPAVQSEVRKTILKSPIMAANAAAGTVGVKLDMIVQNMDFFLPKMSDPDFEKMNTIEKDPRQWEILRREMQTDVNGLYPTFQGGLRVTFPPTRVIENAMRTKRPNANTNTKIPTVIKFALEDDEVYTSKHEVSFVYWSDEGGDYSKRVEVPLVAKEKTEKFGLKREEKTVWKKYTATVPLTHGVYRYHWRYDGKLYFNNGCPYNDFKPETSYQTFSVLCKVQFGIGVQF